MRLFVALALPAAVTEELATTLQRLRRTQSHPVKWVDPAAIHLTLQFLGEVPEAQVAAILVALTAVRDAAAHSPPLELRLASAGAFPNLRRPQTLWMGIAGDVAGLARQQQAVVAALEPLGFQPETRPFRAHLTIGRVRREATPAQQATLGAAIEALPPPQPIAWQSGPPRLFASSLTRGGAVYRELGPA